MRLRASICASLFVFASTVTAVDAGNRLPGGRRSPPPILPHRVSTILAFHDIDQTAPPPPTLVKWETNAQAVDDLAALGFRAVKIWP